MLDVIGGTPLIRLHPASEETGCTIPDKAGFMNTGGSIKDRAAKCAMLDAIERGEPEPGGIIAEGMAGNTGIGLAMVGHALGFRTIITMPRDVS